MNSSAVVKEYQLEVARQLADLWINSKVESEVFEDEDVNIHLVRISEIDPEDEFEYRAMTSFQSDSLEEFSDEYEINHNSYFLYAKPITKSQIRSIRKEGVIDFGSGVSDPSLLDPVEAILVIRRKTTFATIQLTGSRARIVIAGLVGGLISAFVYFFILKRLIFSPVRKLRRVSERVQQGDLTARSSLQTGDEFEELSVAFNEMLDRMGKDQQRLQKMNESLDLKVEELAESNIGLFESSKLKNEFIANVSHELRTPLNSIIGFAELLESMPVETEDDRAKRIRYLHNILTSGRSLLDMINELLDMAKIESGRMEVNLESTSIVDLLEGLSSIMRPQAKVKDVHLELSIEAAMPTVQTDPGKLQQILYNFLSNAIKFTPTNTVIKIVARRVVVHDESNTIQISVQDCGPGIPEDMTDMVFEKFRQVDATHTREHCGTGLGLAICRELAELLHVELSVESISGHGATFIVDIPEVFSPENPEPLMPE